MNGRRDFLKGMLTAFVAAPAIVLGREASATLPVIPPTDPLRNDWYVKKASITHHTRTFQELRVDRQVYDQIEIKLEASVEVYGMPPHRPGEKFPFRYNGRDWYVEIEQTYFEVQSSGQETVTFTGPARFVGDVFVGRKKQ